MYRGNLLFGATFDWFEGGYDQYLDLLDPDTKEKIWRWDGFDSNLGNRNFVIHAILNTTFYGSDTRRLFAVNLVAQELNNTHIKLALFRLLFTNKWVTYLDKLPIY